MVIRPRRRVKKKIYKVNKRWTKSIIQAENHFQQG